MRRAAAKTGVIGKAAAIVAAGALAIADGGCGSSAHHPPAKRRTAAAEPCRAESGLTQSQSGSLSGCVQIGQLSSGEYTLELQDTLEFSSLLADLESKVRAIKRIEGLKAVPPALSRELRQARRRQPRVSLELSPSSGAPGTRVRVTGTLDGWFAHRSRDAQICWDGCRRGLDLSAAGNVRWISRRTFVADVTVPDAPWLEGGVDRVIPLTTADYPISVTCVTGDASCMLASSPEGSAGFKLEDPHPPAWCPSSRSCTRLNVSPSKMAAGALVRVTGHAPLVSWDYGAAPFGGTVTVVAGRPTGTQVALNHDGQQLSARFGHAAFRVVGGPGYASLGRIRPRDTLADGLAQIAADPSNPRIVAWCGARGIEVAAGGRVHQISTRGVDAVLRGLRGLPKPPLKGAARCSGLLPLSSTTVLAAFAGGLPQFDGEMPPEADYALETTNAGRTWAALSAPPGTTADEFGGFRPTQGGVDALYARAPRPDRAPDVVDPLAERTTNRGRSWTPARFECPGPRPCVTLGPFLPGNCAQGLSTQDVLRWDRAGRDWRESPILDKGMFACGDAQLAAIGRGRELLVNAISAFPLQLSTDSGLSWRNLAMPLPNELSSGTSGILQDFGPGGITLLPDGGLLLTGGMAYSGGWQLLRPGTRAWCAVAGRHGTWQFASQASPITVIGHQLWWLTWGRTGGSATPIDLHTLPLSAVRCA